MVPSDSSEIVDPIQRAGARLLSAAAVPIQTEIRRYLAKKHREDRAWAIIVIQSYFRRWRAELMMYKYLYCATKIQAAFRGWLVRDTLSHKHYCATQIQRICKGYLATMKVYEALYNITVVQSIARRNAAIRLAEKRFKSIVLIQSVYRGYLCRRELNYLHHNATIIQTAWRSFSAQMNYEFDIVDIIIVQSIVRRRACQKRYTTMLHQKHTEAATVIQKYWRGYDCTMNYLHSIADILIVQSVVRRWIAMRYVPKFRAEIHNKMALRIQTVARGWVARHKYKRFKAAVIIQKTWRGFKDYIDYIFTLADIVMVQKTARGWLAKRRIERLKKSRQEEKFYNAAVTIQKVWRGYQAHMNMLFSLVHIIIAQSVIRRRMAIVKFKPMLMEYRAAITLQCAWRMKIAKRRLNEEFAARKIQTAVRARIGRAYFAQFKAAIKIQCWYRCQSTRRGYLYFISARKIQTLWRGYDARKLADEERWIREYAATMIQKNWKMSKVRAEYSAHLRIKNAATAIQSQWRCFWEYSHFVILRYELIRIQAAVRGYQTRKRLKLENEMAVVIQSAARVMLAKRYCHMERLYNAVMYSAQISLKYKNSAKKIQKRIRVMHYSLREKKAALVIERFFIWVRTEVEKEIARRERIKFMKKKKKYKPKSTPSAHHNELLENVWDETVELTSKAQKASPSRVSLQQFTERARVLSPRSKEKPRSKERTQSKLISLSPSRRVRTPPSSPLIAKNMVHYLHNKPSPMKVRPDPDGVDLDFDDETSEVSGLTTPSLTPRYLKNKKKSTDSFLDDQLDRTWAQSTGQKSARSGRSRSKTKPRFIEEEEASFKENSPSPSGRGSGEVTPSRSMRYNHSTQARSASNTPTSARSNLLRLSKQGMGNY